MSNLFGQLVELRLVDKMPLKEFGLTRQELVQAIRDGKLRYQELNMHGNPWLKLVRSEVESLVVEKRGESYFHKKKIENELTQVNSQLKKLKFQLVSLERKKAELQASLAIKECT